MVRDQSPGRISLAEHRFRWPISCDGIGMAMDQFPTAPDLCIDARYAGREFGKFWARTKLRTIMFDLDEGNDLIIAINCDAVDGDDRDFLLFSSCVVERLQHLGTTFAKRSERVAQGDIVTICKQCCIAGRIAIENLAKRLVAFGDRRFQSGWHHIDN